MTRRPDTSAIMGLIGLAALIIVGWIVLTALGKPVDREAWVALAGLSGIVGGWVGKTLLGEAPPTPDRIPEPSPPFEPRPTPDAMAEIRARSIATPAVYPLAKPDAVVAPVGQD